MKADRKRKLFELYRQCLDESGSRTSSREAIICPICWKEMDFNQLSIEHIIPQRVGGRHATLTCTKCNNTLGTRLDVHLANFQKAHDALRGSAIIPAAITVDDARVGIDLEWHSRNLRIIEKKSNPHHLAKAEEQFRSGKVKEFQLHLSLGFSEAKLRIALLRIAYLGLFHCLGYRYAETYLLQSIRARIHNPITAEPDINCLVPRIDVYQSDVDRDWIAILGHIEAMPVFLVIIRCRGITTTHHSVFMPGLGFNDMSFYERMRRFSETNTRFGPSSKHMKFLHL
jgi:hypothetical protein